MNVALEYLYRAAGNNKQWNTIIFRNEKQQELGQLESRIK